MTRLTHGDIRHISPEITAHDQRLAAATGKGLLGIACHAWNLDETQAAQALARLETRVVPVTAGEGIITDFSATVAGILNFLGIPARVAPRPDVQGLARAYSQKAQALFMADDFQFIGVNLATGRVADNSFNTGKIYAAALDLMAGKICDKPALVMGCGPVGHAAAHELAARGARVFLHDIDPTPARELAQDLKSNYPVDATPTTDLARALEQAPYIIEATPAADTLPPEMLSHTRAVAAPGVPRGAGAQARALLAPHWLHDKLELGVAAMAVHLIADECTPHEKEIPHGR